MGSGLLQMRGVSACDRGRDVPAGVHSRSGAQKSPVHRTGPGDGDDPILAWFGQHQMWCLQGGWGLFVPLVSLVMDEFPCHSIKGSKTESRRLHPLLLRDADGSAIDWTLQGRLQDGEKLPLLICEGDGSRS